MSKQLSLSNLPDYPALCQLRKTLWGQDEVRGAAVMVGAGFSRCAKRVSPASPIPPLWSTFEREMVAQLYPDSKKNFDPLRLAEEYRAALGQPALDALIHRMVGDDQWQPSDLHSRLLGLPWTDVLTTNWDTLLERTVLPDPDMFYDIVRTISDISRTRSPRIVKLHGSLPSHKPFIFTLEDFRSYPREFSAFINLAQQVLLENDLCLIGFSGDDPNFLQWAGWVRDQLGENARRIRIVGVLNLSPSQREVLKQRNVFPIDLAPLVSDLDSEEAHETAAKIFIDCMWEGRPKPAHEWKRAPVSHTAPKEVKPDEIIEQLIESWQHDRESYPGWLIAPYMHRMLLHMETDRWSQEMRQALPKADPRRRGQVAAELAWRYDIALRPLDDFLIDLFSSALSEPKASQVAKKERICIANMLLTQTRHDRDWENFSRWLDYLENLNDDQASAIMYYQRALRAHSEFNFVELAKLAEFIKGDDPVWHFRRANVYCLLHNYKEAGVALLEAKADIRDRRVQEKKSIWLLSREAWASWFLVNVRRIRPDPSGDLGEKFWPSKYHANDCDPWDHINAIDNEIHKQLEERTKELIRIEPAFDAGSYRDHSRTARFVTRSYSELVDQIILFAEKVGAPRQIENAGLLGERIDRALRVVSDISPKYVWFGANNIKNHSNGTIDNMFGRVDIARLPNNLVIEIADKLIPAIEFSVERTAENIHDWVEPLRAYIELLSRFMIRIPPQKAKETFYWAVELSKHRGLSHWWLAKPLKNLLTRSLESVPPSLRSELSFSILKLPLPCERKIKGYERDWPELSEKFADQDLSGQDFSMWRQRISELIEVVKNGDMLNRTRALLRLSYLVDADILSTEQQTNLASAIWERGTSPNGLPIDSELLPHIYLNLPGPSIGLKSSAFLQSVVTPLSRGEIDADRLISLQHSSSNRYRNVYTLGIPHAQSILEKCLAWNPPPKQKNEFIGSERKETEEIKNAIGSCLAKAVLPKLTADDLTDACFEQWINAIQNNKIPSLLLTIPYLVLFLPDRIEWATRTLRKALASRHEPVILSAIHAMYHFLLLKEKTGLNVPPILSSDVASMCVVRREPGLLYSLAIARYFVYADSFTEDDRLRLADSLGFLFSDFDYKKWSISDPRTRSLSLIRVECVRLAKALEKKGCTEHSIGQWLSIQDSDPFPEVRFAINDDATI